MEITTENFNVVIESAEIPVVVFVKASWCSKCKAFVPVYEKVIKEQEGIANFHYLTVDDNEELTKYIKIMGVPTVLFFMHGVLIAKQIGSQSANSMKRTIESLIYLTPEEAQNKEYRSWFSRLFERK